MDVYREIIEKEVYPALGCTEPVSCAYAAAVAASYLGELPEKLVVRVDPGTYKNGAAVTVPHTNGKKGNLIAAALGAAIAHPAARLEILKETSPDHLRRAVAMCDSGACTIECIDVGCDFRIEVELTGPNHTVIAVLSGGHTNITRVERDGEDMVELPVDDTPDDALAYRRVLRKTDLATLLARADQLGPDDLACLKHGVEMNEAMAARGLDMQATAHQLMRMKEKGFLTDDVFFRVKLRVASAVDARMAGVNQPVMTSGGSGNQGIVAILTPYMVGQSMNVDEERILRSVAIAHLLNAYIKSFVGELSVVCGCAMSAGIAAAGAIVYQQVGVDMSKIALAVNSVIGDLGGLICDGAKPGCAMKSVTAVDAAIRSGLMALENYGLTVDDGLVGHSAEESIRNLGRITLEGMFHVDPTLLKILQDKPAMNTGKREPHPH